MTKANYDSEILTELKAAMRRFRENDLGRKLIESRRSELKKISEEAEVRGSAKGAGNSEFKSVFVDAMKAGTLLDQAEMVVSDMVAFVDKFTEAEKEIADVAEALAKAKVRFP